MIKFGCYCRIFSDEFDKRFTNVHEVEGDEIVNFLLSECGVLHDKKGNKIPGDLNLWYLGISNRGFIQVNDWLRQWDNWESSWEYVIHMIMELRHNNLSIEDTNKLFKNVGRFASKITSISELKIHLLEDKHKNELISKEGDSHGYD